MRTLPCETLIYDGENQISHWRGRKHDLSEVIFCSTPNSKNILSIKEQVSLETGREIELWEVILDNPSMRNVDS